MKNRKGFTLIEIVVSLALLTMCFSVLSYSLSAGYSQYNQSNRYKKSSDKDLAEIQKATISDDSNVTIDSQYTMEAQGKSVKVDLYTYKDPSSSSAPSLSRFIAHDSEFKSNAVKFEYYNVDSTTNQSNKIDELEGRKLSNFDDLPGTQYTALAQSNKDWGKWAFIGWSTAKREYNKSFTGQSQTASKENNYQGLITKDNFDEVMAYYRTQGKTPKLYATYTYSRDVGGNQNELVLLYNTDKSIRFAKDQSN
ncbi:MAG: prepilin-type N-terminal cleavage/methylation domain-containing protein, partial [Intestinibaculum porci]|uniref:type II secretion system protein n=1 Tax=Intestinibaculum porci TaxID=2487118 RepID=UPI002409509B